MSKPVVNFKEVIGFIDVGGFGVRALLRDVTNHPVLGDLREVNTSAVLRMQCDANMTELVELETLNTIYRKEGR
jgi:hypothetical protein